jgi:hypothetical protein
MLQRLEVEFLFFSKIFEVTRQFDAGIGMNRIENNTQIL